MRISDWSSDVCSSDLLYGIDAPELGQFCSARDGRPYDCGLAATNILTRLVGDKDVSCTLFARLPSGAETGALALGGVDLGGVLVRSGWAFSARGLSNRPALPQARAQANPTGTR